MNGESSRENGDCFLVVRSFFFLRFKFGADGIAQKGENGHQPSELIRQQSAQLYVQWSQSGAEHVVRAQTYVRYLNLINLRMILINKLT